MQETVLGKVKRVANKKEQYLQQQYDCINLLPSLLVFEEHRGRIFASLSIPN